MSKMIARSSGCFSLICSRRLLISVDFPTPVVPRIARWLVMTASGRVMFFVSLSPFF